MMPRTVDDVIAEVESIDSRDTGEFGARVKPDTRLLVDEVKRLRTQIERARAYCPLDPTTGEIVPKHRL